MEPDYVEVYEDKASEFRWRRRARNGRTVADSGEGYSRKSDAMAAAMENNPNLPVFAVGSKDS